MAKAGKPGKAPSPDAGNGGRPLARVLAFAPEKPGQFTASEKALQALGRGGSSGS